MQADLVLAAIPLGKLTGEKKKKKEAGQVQFPSGIFAFDFQVLSRRSRTFVVSMEMGKESVQDSQDTGSEKGCRIRIGIRMTVVRTEAKVQHCRDSPST